MWNGIPWNPAGMLPKTVQNIPSTQTTYNFISIGRAVFSRMAKRRKNTTKNSLANQRDHTVRPSRHSPSRLQQLLVGSVDRHLAVCWLYYPYYSVVAQFDYRCSIADLHVNAKYTMTRTYFVQICRRLRDPRVDYICSNIDGMWCNACLWIWRYAGELGEIPTFSVSSDSPRRRYSFLKWKVNTLPSGADT